MSPSLIFPPRNNFHEYSQNILTLSLLGFFKYFLFSRDIFFYPRIFYFYHRNMSPCLKVLVYIALYIFLSINIERIKIFHWHFTVSGQLDAFVGLQFLSSFGYSIRKVGIGLKPLVT